MRRRPFSREFKLKALAQTTFLTHLSRLRSAEHTATPYALLSSTAPTAWWTPGGAIGVMAQELSWPRFTATILCAMPGILTMTYLMRCFTSGLPPQIVTHATS